MRKSQKHRGVRMSYGIHWYILSRVCIIMYKNVNYISALIHSPHLCTTYLSFHAILTSLVESPFLVWSVLIKCNAMDKKAFSLSFLFIYCYYYYYYHYYFLDSYFCVDLAQLSTTFLSLSSD